MLVLSSHIEIGKLKFDFVTEVEITSSWKTGTDTARITLPRKLWIKNGSKEDSIKDGILKYIKQGDRVLIKLGYDGYLQPEFEGVVSSIKPDAPFEVFCEDYMYYLKRITIKETKNNISLYNLVNFFIDEYNKMRNAETDPEKYKPELSFQASPLTMLGTFNGKGRPLSKIFEDFKAEGIYSFFRGNKLYVGYQSELFKETPPIRFGFQENIISDDLTYRLNEDVKIKIQGISHLPNGNVIEESAGDDEGGTQTMNVYNYDRQRLKDAVQERLKMLKRDGYNGSFTTFGLNIKHGDTLELKDDEYTERSNQVYQVDTVETTFGAKGFRRKITPGYRIKS